MSVDKTLVVEGLAEHSKTVFPRAVTYTSMTFVVSGWSLGEWSWLHFPLRLGQLSCCFVRKRSEILAMAKME